MLGGSTSGGTSRTEHCSVPRESSWQDDRIKGEKWRFLRRFPILSRLTHFNRLTRGLSRAFPVPPRIVSAEGTHNGASSPNSGCAASARSPHPLNPAEGERFRQEPAGASPTLTRSAIEGEREKLPRWRVGLACSLTNIYKCVQLPYGGDAARRAKGADPWGVPRRLEKEGEQVGMQFEKALIIDGPAHESRTAISRP